MKIKKVMLGAALVLAGLVFSACANSAIGESTTTTSDVSHVIGVTHSTKQQLLAAFIAYKTTYSGMTSQDAIMWSTYNPYVVKSVPVEAWDATTRKFYALASSRSRVAASRLGISFQDGGRLRHLYRSPGGSWVVEPFNAVPMCSSVFPQVVATLWHFVDAGACSNPQ